MQRQQRHSTGRGGRSRSGATGASAAGPCSTHRARPTTFPLQFDPPLAAAAVRRFLNDELMWSVTDDTPPAGYQALAYRNWDGVRLYFRHGSALPSTRDVGSFGELLIISEPGVGWEAVERFIAMLLRRWPHAHHERRQPRAA